MIDGASVQPARMPAFSHAPAPLLAKMLTHFNNITLDVRGYLFEGRRVINKYLSDGVDASCDR